ncbi:MAG: alpha-galactosidase [Eubacterium sp.]|nr:alpha-galactosidase [Eubacterium sp.]MDE6766736.1 alpha-galactosidase [Eubacterium sp.]
MNIIKQDNNIFILETENTHYVIGIDEIGYNHHIHWGKKCNPADYYINDIGDENSNHTMLDEYRQELTPFGQTMYRDCDIKAEFDDKCREINLEYIGSSSTENTLSLTFADRYYPLEITLHYQIFEGLDIIKRYTTLKNTGTGKICFERIASAQFNLPSVKPYTFRNTNGAWGGEFIESNNTLDGGYTIFESHRGASNHNNSPYFIAYQNADENTGDVYFASLAYSGNFKVSCSRDLYGVTRVVMGMNDFDFSHTLNGGESLDTPPVYCGYTQGFGDMTRQMNRFCVNHLLPKQFNNETLPVLYNSWEATEFAVNVKQQTELARLAAKMGVELFVMDDGWFGQRKNDRAGLGDWYVNKEKFPNGLDELINAVNELGMDFGIWVEPEMVNADSDLFRAHPDWAYHYPNRKACELRNQLVLNMTREDVQDYIFNVLNDLLSNHNIKYVKWDMNRPFSETGAENLENPQMYSYLHTMAVYSIVDKLKEQHPDVAIESCASGGGRCDLGALSHYDQAWTSDNTDGIDRMTIQKGYSLLRPTKTMRAWVTDIAGINKPCSLDFRFAVAMQGSLGIGGDLTKYSVEDLEICKKNIEIYKQIRDIVQFGDLYRVLDIEKDEVLLNQYVSKDKSKAVAFLLANGTRFYKKRIPVCFKGLDDNKQYKLTVQNKTYEKSGAYLAAIGIPLHIRGVDYNEVIIIEEV